MASTRFAHGLTLPALFLFVVALSGCGGCQERELAPPKPVKGQLPRPAAKARDTVPPAKDSCAVLAYADTEEGSAPLTVQLTAEGDCSVGEARISWDFGDGSPPASEPVVTHTFTTRGTFTVRVTMTSSTNSTLKDSDDVRITVGAPKG